MLELKLELKQTERDPRLDEFSPQSQCEYCKGPVTLGEVIAKGICSDCYWMIVGRDEEPVAWVRAEGPGPLDVEFDESTEFGTAIPHGTPLCRCQSQQGVAKPVEADDYKTWYEEAIARSNGAGFTGMSAAQVIDYQDGEIVRLRADNTRLVRALEAIGRMDYSDDHSLINAVLVARNALAGHPVGQQPAPDVEKLVDALERVMYCNEFGFLPEGVQQAVSYAHAYHHKPGDE